MHGSPKLLFSPVLEGVDDVDVDVEADQEGDAELEDNSAYPITDPGVSTPLLPADLNTLLMDRKLMEKVIIILKENVLNHTSMFQQ